MFIRYDHYRLSIGLSVKKQRSENDKFSMTTRNWIKFILLSVIWGTNFLWTRIVVNDIGPLILVFFRILFGFFTIFIYVFANKTKIYLTWPKLGVFVVLGFFNVTLPFLLITWAQQTISSGLAGVMNTTYPLFSFLFAAIFLPEERISWFRAVGLLIGFCGALVLATSGFSGSKTVNSLTGIIAMLFASISYAFALIYAKKTARRMNANEQSIGQISIALITISITTILFESRLRLPTLPLSWIGLVWSGVLCTGVGTILWYSLLNSAGTTLTSLTSYVSPVIAVILGIIFLQEEFIWQIALGGTLIILGVIWANSSRDQNKQPEALND